jgi:hypothetical protein
MLHTVHRIFLIVPIFLILQGSNLCWSADFQKGLTAYKSNDIATALREWKPLAEQGNADAQFHLGLMYRYGVGVPQDDKTAAYWYRLAADQGHASAQFALGVMYDNGRGVPQNDKTAVKWYRLAAEQGHASAQFALGLMYDNGLVSLQDVKPSPSQTGEVPSVKTRKSPQTPSKAADASDFRIAPSPKLVSSMNDIHLCKHDYVRELPFIQAEVKKRYLDCTAILSVMVEQKRRDRQVKVEQEKVRLAREQRAKEDQAQRERTSAEQARLRAEAAQMAQQRRRLVELQERQLELQRKQLKAAKSRDRSNALMNLGRALQGFSAQPSYRPAPAPSPAFPSLGAKCTVYNNGWNNPTLNCR